MPRPPEISPKSRRIAALRSLFDKLSECPIEWGAVEYEARTAIQLEPLHCESYELLIDAWKQAMVWTPGLDSALAVMLASSMSVMLAGDQLWVKIIGPASCGKSTLCEALSVCTKYVVAKSTIRGFHSGFGEGEHNLIDEINGKALITKDGDTIVQSPNIGQILSEGRDLYDTVSRSSYRNKASKDHIGKRTVWILAGTSSLREIDHSELGERFLDCVIMEGIDSDLEKLICLSAARDAAKSVQIRVTKDAETRNSPEMTLAWRLTAGYLMYLRENDSTLTSGVAFTEERLLELSTFGRFVAHMRARPSKKQDESTERELAARLTKQHTRLAMCLGAVLNKQEVDDEVIERTKKITLDTARGHTFEITKRLYASKTGMELTALASSLNLGEDRLREMLRFLVKIDVLDAVRKPQGPGLKGPVRYRISEKFLPTYLEVMR